MADTDLAIDLLIGAGFVLAEAVPRATRRTLVKPNTDLGASVGARTTNLYRRVGTRVQFLAMLRTGDVPAIRVAIKRVISHEQDE